MTLPHQAEKVEEFTGTSTTRLRCEKTKVQICLVKTQDNSRWGLFPTFGHRTDMPGVLHSGESRLNCCRGRTDL